MSNEYLKIAVSLESISIVTARQWALERAVDGDPEPGCSAPSMLRLQANRNLRDRLIGKFQHFLQLPDMSLEWTCCGAPTLDLEQSKLGSIASSALSIYSCAHCGRKWLAVQLIGVRNNIRFTPLSDGGENALLVASSGENSEELLKEKVAAMLARCS
jgi:hypothetical protein